MNAVASAVGEAKRASILLVLPSVPWPARRSGFSLRYFPLLRHLAAHHRVHLVMLGDRDAWGEMGPLKDWCQVTQVDVGGPARSQWQRFHTILRGLSPGSAPYALRSAWTSKIVATIAEVARRERFDVLLWAGPAFLEAALTVARMGLARRCVFDLVDSPTLLERRAQSKPNSGASADFERWETRIQEAADLTIYISSADAQAVAPMELRSPKLVIPNGLFLEDLIVDSDAPEMVQSAPYVLFFGHMSYHPNVDAARRLAQEIMPAIRERIPDVQLIIMGHQPAPEVLALRDSHTCVTGSVPSIWPYVRGAAACVFPLRLGTGLQNKILESLAVGTPVVTTKQCAANLAGAMDGQHLLVRDSVAEIAAATIHLLQDHVFARKIGERGERFVRERYDWQVIARSFEEAILSSVHPKV
jgi:glycosyltransferase involved in cell wall biosynthesis